MNQNEVVESVLPDYEKELSDKEEQYIGAVRNILNGNNVKDELVRSRIFAKSKAFGRDLIIAGQSNFGSIVEPEAELEPEAEAIVE